MGSWGCDPLKSDGVIWVVVLDKLSGSLKWAKNSCGLSESMIFPVRQIRDPRPENLDSGSEIRDPRFEIPGSGSEILDWRSIRDSTLEIRARRIYIRDPRSKILDSVSETISEILDFGSESRDPRF